MPGLFNSPFWSRGFRPFFFLGAIQSIVSILLWGGVYAGYILPSGYWMDPVSWHVHEMIYGFVVAIVAGFLLTAVANWTGGAPVREIHLIVLVLIWSLGRIFVSFDVGLPKAIQILGVTLFVPCLTISLMIPLMRSWSKRNFIFLILLCILFGCDIWFLISTDMRAMHMALFMILAMVSLIGGRVIPAFTVAALRRRGIVVYQTNQNRLDVMAWLSLLVVAVAVTLSEKGVLLGVTAGGSCLIHALRMRYYHTLRVWSDPLSWILHIGYSWLVLGLGSLSLAGFRYINTTIAIHVLTVGCIGSMILGMMCRVTLGHTGRNLKISGATIFSFILMQIAVFIRILGPILIPQHTVVWIGLTACLWGVCFSLFLVCFGPILFAKSFDQ